MSFEEVAQQEWRALVRALHCPDGPGCAAVYGQRQMERMRWGRRLRKAKRVIDSLA